MSLKTGTLRVTHNLTGRIIECRMRGLFGEADRIEAATTIRHETDLAAGKRHIVVADMCGMKTVHPSIARHMGEAIGYQRTHGCVLCVHVSDDTVQRLQAAHLARQYSRNDDVTIEADSIAQARSIARSYEKYLDDPKYRGSIREAIPSTGAAA